MVLVADRPQALLHDVRGFDHGQLHVVRIGPQPDHPDSVQHSASIGGGALQPISQAILVESFPRHKQGMAMSVYGMGVVVALVIGPTLGGWTTDNYSWRWIFLINIPVGALSLTLTSLLIWDPVYLVRKAWKGMKVDYMGLGLLSLGLASLEITLDDGQKNDWFGSNFIVTMAVIALVGLVGVVL